MINPTFRCAIEKGCIDRLSFFSARMCIMCATARMRGRITRAVVDTAIHPGRRIAHAVIGERGTNMKRLCAHGSGRHPGGQSPRRTGVSTRLDAGLRGSRRWLCKGGMN